MKRYYMVFDRSGNIECIADSLRDAKAMDGARWIIETRESGKLFLSAWVWATYGNPKGEWLKTQPMYAGLSMTQERTAAYWLRTMTPTI